MSNNFFNEILGNHDLKDRLSKDVSDDRLSHAYILEGQKGSGRHTFALQTVAAIECEKRNVSDAFSFFSDSDSTSIPCGCCPSCKKILGGLSPDIKTVGLVDDRATVGVDSVRLVTGDMYTAPNELSVKVYIMEDADLMTVQAQNALLLSLEEPPEYVLFFLLCQNAGDMLETVRSRAPTLRTQRIPSDMIENHLLSHLKEAEDLKKRSESDWKSLLCVAEGSIGYAIELLNEKKLEGVLEDRAATKELIDLLTRKNKLGAFDAISSFGTKRQEVCQRLMLLQYALRDLLLIKKYEEASLCFFENAEEAHELSESFTVKGLLKLYEASCKALDDLDMNSNVRLTLIGMMQNAGLL